MSKKILLVCSGNTCRSIMAEAILRDIVDNKNLSSSIMVLSAGLSAVDGSQASDEAIEVMKEWGYDIKDHMARRLTQDMINDCDIVLTMTRTHKEMINAIAPGNNYKVFTLKELLPQKEELEDISDPYGADIKQYRKCAREIRDTLERITSSILDLLEDSVIVDSKFLCIGSDHAGFELKEYIKTILEESKMNYDDLGTFSDEPVDYPDIGEKVAKMVARGDYKRGILLCGTGVGMSMVANRVPGVRAALCHDVFSAKASREHNDSNILIMGGRVLGKGHASVITETWLNTMFTGGRHSIRINKIDKLKEE